MRLRLAIPILCSALIALGGCDVTIDSVNGFKPSEGGDLPEVDGGGRVTIINAGVTALVGVYVSPCSSNEWGRDLLSGRLTPGEQEAFGPFAPGCYDVRVDNERGSSGRFPPIQLGEEGVQLTYGG